MGTTEQSVCMVCRHGCTEEDENGREERRRSEGGKEERKESWL